ncbi:hypothetical protein Y032_0197g1555 [Ancylostoma ceylanicum]|uniref:Uncharacterized protein n=1 Tax=Ancylostoma ceylanicum TaxID=53326 RepID=A0A016SP61_9BILA|nr:hypothetical protein Y032_0197g1555 [Ancylostoma ceylanicum]
MGFSFAASTSKGLPECPRVSYKYEDIPLTKGIRNKIGKAMQTKLPSLEYDCEREGESRACMLYQRQTQGILKTFQGQLSIRGQQSRVSTS